MVNVLNSVSSLLQIVHNGQDHNVGMTGSGHRF